MSVTLRDVARKAGLSIATVSRVLNGHVQVSPEARARVEQAVQELGYEPAQRRKPTGSGTIAVVMPNLNSFFFTEILRGAEQTAYERGYSLTLYTTDGRSKQEVHSRLKHLPDAAGVLLVTAGPQQFGSDFLGRPVVVVDYGSEGSPFPHVTVDNLRAGFAATQCLIEAGHTAIGIITGPLGMQSAQDRLRGFRLALDEAGINFPANWIWESDFTEAGGYAAARAMLEQGRAVPTALFCCNDLMAIGALRALRERGMTVPQDIAIVGFDNQPVSAAAFPALTTVAQPMFELGETALRVLLRLVGGEELETNRIVLDTQLVKRHSV
ncbi:MAG: LacI family transcriptional regulator [Firmicutes bacterium]|nr:LacI family transcriptional regulator [Bacillota bacterium]